MKMVLIAIQCDTKNKIIGFRIMDKDSGDIIDQPYENVKAVINKGIPIEGINIEKGSL